LIFRAFSELIHDVFELVRRDALGWDGNHGKQQVEHRLQVLGYAHPLGGGAFLRPSD